MSAKHIIAACSSIFGDQDSTSRPGRSLRKVQAACHPYKQGTLPLQNQEPNVSPASPVAEPSWRWNHCGWAQVHYCEITLILGDSRSVVRSCTIIRVYRLSEMDRAYDSTTLRRLVHQRLERSISRHNAISGDAPRFIPCFCSSPGVLLIVRPLPGFRYVFYADCVFLCFWEIER